MFRATLKAFYVLKTMHEHPSKTRFYYTTPFP